MLWIAVCLPHLPLEVHAAADVPLAIGDAQGVTHANTIARQAGVDPGMRRATALALCPTLRVIPRDPVKERQALHAVAMWALQFTPKVSLLPIDETIPSGLLLEVRGSLRLFDGVEAIEYALRRGLAAQGHAAQLAVAPTAQAAWLLARSTQHARVMRRADLHDAVLALPAWLLEAGRASWDKLQGIGVKSIGDLHALPRAGMTQRFSGALIDEIDRALGTQPDPRVWFTAPPTFACRVELMARVESAEALLFAARRLIVQLCGWLAARQGATRALQFTLVHESRAPTRLPLKLVDASHDETRVTTLLREALMQLQLAAPVYELQLFCDDVVAAPLHAARFFPEPQAEREALAHLLERLMVRLGRERVLRLQLRADHRPELAYNTCPADISTRTDSSAPEGGPARPLWLMPEPIPLEVRQHTPLYGSPLSLVAGPERIESGWWDGPWVARDYFVAQDAAHALYWIFRPRAPDPSFARGSGWWLHGRFG
jgi:protein ImuB